MKAKLRGAPAAGLNWVVAPSSSVAEANRKQRKLKAAGVRSVVRKGSKGIAIVLTSKASNAKARAALKKRKITKRRKR